MKTIATLLLSATTFIAFAQTNTRQSLHQDIDDNGKLLTININGTSNGKKIQYYRQFDVAGMTKQARQSIIDRITDSLGVNRTPQTPVPPAAATNSSSTSVSSTVHTSVHEHNDIMSVNITGAKDGAPLNYNRSFKVKGLSKQQKDKLVRHVTDSLGIGPVPKN